MTSLLQATRTSSTKMGLRRLLLKERALGQSLPSNTRSSHPSTVRFLHHRRHYSAGFVSLGTSAPAPTPTPRPAPTPVPSTGTSSTRCIHSSHTALAESLLNNANNNNNINNITNNNNNIDNDEYYFPSPPDSQDMDPEEAEERDAARRQAIRDELDTRKGRLWEDPWALTDDDWSSGKSFDDLPDWTEQICSRVSLERVNVHPHGIPTLDTLATLNLPPSAVPHPATANPKPYLTHRKNAIYNTIYKTVVAVSKSKMDKILELERWEEKQDAIDDLFEGIHDAVRFSKMANGDDGNNNENGNGNSNEYMSVVLGSQPNFPKLVERALEEYLRSVVKDEKNRLITKANTATSKESNDSVDDNNGDNNDDDTMENIPTNHENENDYQPIFMDLLKSKDAVVNEDGIPNIIAPIKTHPHDGPGRMIEEWELSAKEDTKRIMCRSCMTEIAQALVDTQGGESDGVGARVYVKGRAGAGKSAALTAIVASARTSGHIVLFLPDGERLSSQGFYLEPNAASKTRGELMFDLPILTNELCTQLLASHETDLEGMVVSADALGKYLTPDQLDKLEKSIDSKSGEDGEYPLVDLLKLGTENVVIGSGCYGAVIHTLMNQQDKPFTVVMDEFNSYFGQGHFFHEMYDPKVLKNVPMSKITLVQPFLDAVGVEKLDDGSFLVKEAVPMKRGGIVVGVTESHAVARATTLALSEAVETAGCQLVDVHQYTPIEVEHILANFEIIGIGRLRFDRGATVMNSQEVAYLRMVSSGLGQRLLDSCLN
jgi:hypothetical protein